MADTMPGWYPDPSDSTKTRYWDGSAWTDQVHESAPKKNRLGLILGIGIPAVLIVGALVIAGVVAAINGAQARIGDNGPGGSAGDKTPDVASVPSDHRVPAGWQVASPPSGSVTYYVDPTWTEFTDLLGDPADTMGEVPGGGALEFSGAWLMDGSFAEGGTNVILLSATYGKDIRNVSAELTSYMLGASAAFEDVDVVASDTFTTVNGYKAARRDITGQIAGDDYSMIVFAVTKDDAIVFVQISSDQPLETYVDDAVAVANSLVINHTIDY